MAKNKNTKRGEVIEALPGMKFRVDVEGAIIMCHLAGKLRLNHIRITLGDKVEVAISPDGKIGRIEWRY